MYKVTKWLYTTIMMNYIIFDLEWNQCPNGKEEEVKELPFESLEIGAVKLDSQYREVSRFSMKIRPQVYTSLHFRTKEILHLDMESLKGARPFPDAARKFFTWCGSPAYFCTWGSLDLYELQRNLAYYKMKNPFPAPLRYYNVQKLFSLVYEEKKSSRSLEYAADFLHLAKSRPFHSALNDALYTAEVLKRLPSETVLKNFSFDYYQNPKSRKEEIFAVYDNCTRFVSKEFPSKNQAMKDRKVTSTRCCLCGQNARRKIRWFSSGNNNYYSLSYCQQHGWLKGKIHIKKAQSGNFFCVKTLMPAQKEEAAELAARQQALRQKKRAPRKKEAL